MASHVADPLVRYHQTLKSMLKKYCLEYPEDWDKGIPFVLFATRDAPSELLGLSPFELVYGHEVRGPLKFIKDKFLSQEEGSNLLDYVSNFRDRLKKACDLAKENLVLAQGKMKGQYDKRSETRSFEPGDKVLVLLPVQGESLKAKFSGPYKILEKQNDVNYIICTPDRRKSKRLCHVNMLKPYQERKSEEVNAVAIVTLSQEAEGGDLNEEGSMSHNSPVGVKVSNSKVLENVETILEHLSESQQRDILELLRDYQPLFQDELGCTPLIEHDIEVGNATPCKLPPYRTNPEKLRKIREEVQYMLEHDLIEPSQSSWSSPVVLIPKPDGSSRLCIDFRKVNGLTKADSFPIPRIEDCIEWDRLSL